MCEPNLIIAGLSIASTAIGHAQADESARTQTKALQDQANANQNALDLQANQVASQAAEESNERARQARAEAATFDAIAGEYGGGNTVSRQANELAFRSGSDLAMIQKNRSNQLAQIGSEKQGVAARTNSQLASISRPSALGTALTIGAHATRGYMEWDRLQLKPTGGPAAKKPAATVDSTATQARTTTFA